MPRRRDPFDTRSMAASLAVHGAILVLGWVGTLSRPEPLEFFQPEIALVSPAPPVQAPEPELATEELVVETPEPVPPTPPEEDEPPVLIEEPEPEPEVPVEQPVEQPPEPDEEATPATSEEEPPEDVEETGAGINVRLEGVRRDYPAYYNNIILQIDRCFRWRGAGGLEVTVYFVIERDGSVPGRELRVVERSGNAAFDIAAVGAIECAGRGRFGALPEELPFDQLPVQFSFRPSGTPEWSIPANGLPAEDASER